jgi:hypothetical protein
LLRQVGLTLENFVRLRRPVLHLSTCRYRPLRAGSMAASILFRGPRLTNGTPCASSSRPGASPTSMRRVRARRRTRFGSRLAEVPYGTRSDLGEGGDLAEGRAAPPGTVGCAGHRLEPRAQYLGCRRRRRPTRGAPRPAVEMAPLPPPPSAGPLRAEMHAPPALLIEETRLRTTRALPGPSSTRSPQRRSTNSRASGWPGATSRLPAPAPPPFLRVHERHVVSIGANSEPPERVVHRDQVEPFSSASLPRRSSSSVSANPTRASSDSASGRSRISRSLELLSVLRRGEELQRWGARE